LSLMMVRGDQELSKVTPNLIRIKIYRKSPKFDKIVT
jgi:hypothetical protein